MTLHTRTPAGLDGVVAAATALSHIDGERGELIIAGERVDDLAGRVRFEALTARLWSLASGTAVEETETRIALGEARVKAFRLVPAVLDATQDLPVTAAFRVAVAALRPVEGLTGAAVLAGGMPVLAAALMRRARGEAPVAPDPARGQADDTLRMLRAETPSAAEAAALDAYLVTASDHGMNASTFTARVVASTQADPFMAVTAAYCALTGPLHGGAPGPVLDMLDAIGTRDRIRSWIAEALVRGDRLMGFGHRVYRVRDPRADVLRKAVASLGRTAIDLGLAAEVESEARAALARAKPDRPLDTNVEFYTAILLDALAIPREAFTPIFAAARVAGWTAHAMEQQRTGRLLRPDSVYVGVMPASPGE
ncbi:citrate synthase [Aquibium microcysteis]|uniref:citrate synthase n=1 Tax=Aquibium microcysteis TaxID=675281 RepID=UPI00165D142A|nr:citrate synthase [Aquibium microcysteis]